MLQSYNTLQWNARIIGAVTPITVMLVNRERQTTTDYCSFFFFLSPPLEKPYRLHCTVKICQAMNKNKHSNEVMKEKKEFFPTRPEMWWAVQWPHTLDKLI